MRKFNKKSNKGFDRKDKSVFHYSVKDRDDTTAPDQESITNNSSMLQDLTFKNLREAQPVTLYATPFDPIKASGPYFIINKMNKMMSANYGREANLRGNALDMIVNSSKTRIYDMFDAVVMEIRNSYRFLCSDSTLSPNYANNRQMGKNIDQALSTTSAETYTDLPFFQRNITSPESATFTQVVYTDEDHDGYNSSTVYFKKVTDDNGDSYYYSLGTISHEVYLSYIYTEIVEDVEVTKIALYTDLSGGVSTTQYFTGSDLPIHAMPKIDSNNYGLFLTWMQAHLMNTASVVIAYNKLMAMERFIDEVQYNRGVSGVNDIFGLFHKSAFITLMESVSDTITGEYFDIDWYSQMKTLSQIPSKKSMSMSDPLISIVSTFAIPSIQVKANASADTPIITNSSTDVTFKYYSKYSTSVAGSKPEVSTKTLSFEETCRRIIRKLDPVNVIAWLRKKFVNPASLGGENDGSTTLPYESLEYYNEVCWMIEGLRNVANRFSSFFDDIRVVLRVAQRAGLNNWTQGVKIEVVPHPTPYIPVYNKVVNDTLVSTLASSHSLTWSDKTLRWTFHSAWNKFTGVNEFDELVGGSFLAMSTRGVEVRSDDDLFDSKFILPIQFTVSEVLVKAVSQSGKTINIAWIALDADDIDDSKILYRLNVVGDKTLKIRIPEVAWPVSGLTVPEISNIYTLIENLFLIGKVPTAESTYDTVLSADLLTYLPYQVDGVTNNMVVYYQVNSPLKVYSSKTNIIGFNK